MKIQKLLIGCRPLDFETKDGQKILGSQLFVLNMDLKNEQDNRIPEKIFISGDTSFAYNLQKVVNKVDRDFLVPIELECTLNGTKVRYSNAKSLLK